MFFLFFSLISTDAAWGASLTSNAFMCNHIDNFVLFLLKQTFLFSLCKWQWCVNEEGKKITFQCQWLRFLSLSRSILLLCSALHTVIEAFVALFLVSSLLSSCSQVHCTVLSNKRLPRPLWDRSRKRMRHWEREREKDSSLQKRQRTSAFAFYFFPAFFSLAR